jgi:hypothetical protein
VRKCISTGAHFGNNQSAPKAVLAELTCIVSSLMNLPEVSSTRNAHPAARNYGCLEFCTTARTELSSTPSYRQLPQTKSGP